MELINPILPGFYPDPSVCRVGDDYYLVTSSFEYFPGVPLFHSKDLINWTPIGHCLTRSSQLRLDQIERFGSIYAPTIRYHGGTFHMITTNVTGGGHFFVHTRDIHGEWSEPIWINGDGHGTGHDPDLFFDDDGKVYYTRFTWDSSIMQWEIDITTGRLLGEGKTIWYGFEDRYCEAPHLYKMNGLYYLFAAEGGTWRGHMVVVARSEKPGGPGLEWNYRSNPDENHWTLREREGWLTLHGTPETLSDRWGLCFLGRRQTAFECTASVCMDFEPAFDGEEAGMCCIMNEHHHYEIAVSSLNGKKVILVRRRIGDLEGIVFQTDLPSGPVTLSITADMTAYHFGYACDLQDISYVAKGQAKYLSSEVAGGFTGVYLGLYATGNGKRCRTPAHFDWFEYSVVD